MSQLVDETEVPKLGTDESYNAFLLVGAVRAIVNVDIALRWPLIWVEDREEDVLGLEVAVDDLFSVEILDPLEDR